MEIKSLKGIEEMNDTINSIREHIQEESVIDWILYDNYIGKLYKIILAIVLAIVDEGKLYKE